MPMIMAWALWKRDVMRMGANNAELDGKGKAQDKIRSGDYKMKT